MTCTAGTFGAVAACGKLFGFDEGQMLSAFFLVLGGMRGSAEILNAEDGGIFPMMSDEYDYALVSKDLGSVYEILRMDRKPYPCCRSTHCAVDAARRLKEAYGLSSKKIQSVEVGTYKVGVKQCGTADSSINPQLPTDAKFSTPYVVACALLYGNVSFHDFHEDMIQRNEVRNFMHRVKVVEDLQFTNQYPKHWGCRMKIGMKDGTEYSTIVEDALGSEHVPLSRDCIVDKARSCCGKFDLVWVETLIRFIFSLNEQKVMLKLEI